MVAVVKRGTGTAAAAARRDRRRQDRHRDQPARRSHAWFVAFAPAEAPRVAVAIVVENVGYGGTYAAPIAREVLRVALARSRTLAATVEPIRRAHLQQPLPRRRDRSGNGGMAIVYCGTDLLLRRRVAIKVLREQYARDDDFVSASRTKRSRRRSSRIRTSSTSTTSGARTTPYFIVMELVDGATLGDICATSARCPSRSRSTTRPRSRAASPTRTAKACCTATSSPRTSWSPRTTSSSSSDFGIARAVSEHTLGVTQPGMVMGSVAYISPEQAQGHELDERCDLYSRRRRALPDAHRGAAVQRRDAGRGRAQARLASRRRAIDPAATASARRSPRSSDRLLQKNPRQTASPRRPSSASALREARERPASPHAGDASPTRRPSHFGAVSRAGAAAAALGRARPPAQRGRTVVATETDERAAQRPTGAGFCSLRCCWSRDRVGYLRAARAARRTAAKTSRVPNLHRQECDPGAAVARRARAARRGHARARAKRVPQDRVIRQDPRAGRRSSRGTTIVALVVSSGLPRVQVPDVKGYNVADAQRELQKAKLKTKIVASSIQRAPSGTVLDVSPAARHVAAPEQRRSR